MAIAGGGVLIFLLPHFTLILKRAAQRSASHVASAVMLNAKLKPGVNLLRDRDDALAGRSAIAGRATRSCSAGPMTAARVTAVQAGKSWWKWTL